MRQVSIGLFLLAALCQAPAFAQSLTMPPSGGNQKSAISQRIGITDITITWDAPGVRGREGKIWGTQVAHFGFQDPGFGTSKAAPWRAGSNECTTISFSTDVRIEGKDLKAGKYGFFIALYADSCTLIFSKNSTAWGSYFYKPEEDALRVTVRQQKDLPQSREWLAYTFADATDHSATIALEWERWRIPFRVEVDLAKTVVASMRRELEGSVGFVASNWQAAAQFCHDHDTNLEEALTWAENAVNGTFGPATFQGFAVKADILRKLNRAKEADATMEKGVAIATVFELHGYARQLVAQKKPKEALAIFEKNYQKHGETWPTHVGLARGYSANGQIEKALAHAKLALAQAPDDLNKKSVESMVKTLSEGKALVQ